MRFCNRYFPLWALSLAACLPALSTHAQVAPDAGQSIRDLETAPLRLPSTPDLELNLPAGDAAQASMEGPTLQVKGFRLSGNQAIGSDELMPLLTDLEGRELSLGELQAAAQRLSAYYHERGYLLTRAYLPAQEVEGGVVEIALLEGRYGEVGLVNRTATRAAVFAPLRQLSAGEWVRAATLERSLLLLADTPGVQIRSTLRPGASVGASDLIVEALPGPRIAGSVDLDNYGNRFTGGWRLGGSLDVNNPLGLGDALNLRAMGSDEDQRYLRAAYQLPVGRWATRLGAAYSYMNYELGEDFRDLDAHGTAKIATLHAIQPLIRSRALNVYGQLQLDDKRLSDHMDRLDSRSDKQSRVWIASLTGNLRDGLGGGGVNSFSVSYSHGDLSLDSELDRLLDAYSARAHGEFNKLNASLLRLQKLPGQFSLSTRLQGQWASGNLDSSEKFSLGGAYGVRAYPQGEASGDAGWLLNVELHYALGSHWQLSTFVDHGRVKRNAEPWSQGDNHRRLSAAGLAARWEFGAWRLNAVSAWKLGSEEPQSDSDRSPRLWVQAMWHF